MNKTRLWLRILRCLPAPWAFIATLVLGNMAIVGSVAILGSVVTRDAINAFLYKSDALRQTAVTLAVISTLLILAVTLIPAFLCNTWSKRTALSMKNAVLSHTMRLPQAVLNARSTSQVYSVATSDLEQLEAIFDGGLHRLVSPSIVGLVCLGTAVWMDWRLALVQLFFVLLASALGVRWQERMGRAGHALQEAKGNMAAVYGETLANTATIRQYGLQTLIDRRFALVNQGLVEKRQALVQLEGLADGLNQLLLSSAYIGVLGFGAWLALRGAVTWGAVAAVLSLQAGVEDLGKVGGAWAQLQASSAGVWRVFALLDEEVDGQASGQFDSQTGGQTGSQIVHPALAKGTVELEQVSFQYPDHPQRVLCDVSLKLKPGVITSVTGDSGCGKSSLAKVIMGLYPPQSGSVRVSGRVANLPQSAFLFDDTVYNNILCGNPQATEAEVIRAAVLAHADVFIRQLPAGYETRAGEHGALLSGGQRQRIALARALLRNPDVLVLDEPTAALDPLSEREVTAALRALAPERTTLLISHREQTLRCAHAVYHMENGRLRRVR